MTKRYNPFRSHPPLRCYPSAKGLNSVSFLEIGPGRGDFLFELARRHSDCLVAAIEIKPKRFYKLVKRIQKNGLSNIRLILGDARVALPCLFDKNQLQATYILFSDPWPKKRHGKHRVFQPYFVHDLYRTLRSGGHVVLAHDDARYLKESRSFLLGHPAFTETPLSQEERSSLFQTFYADKWREAGRTLDACRVQKQKLSFCDESLVAYQSAWFRNWWWRRRNKITS